MAKWLDTFFEDFPALTMEPSLAKLRTEEQAVRPLTVAAQLLEVVFELLPRDLLGDDPEVYVIIQKLVNIFPRLVLLIHVGCCFWNCLGLGLFTLVGPTGAKAG